MARTRTKVMGAVAVGLLGLIFGGTIWPFVVGGRQMRSFCESLRTGSPAAEVERLALERGYTPHLTPADEQPDLIHDRRTMGRYLCEVRWANGTLSSSRYLAND